MVLLLGEFVKQNRELFFEKSEGLVEEQTRFNWIEGKRHRRIKRADIPSERNRGVRYELLDHIELVLEREAILETLSHSRPE